MRFFIATNGLDGMSRECSYGVIVIMTLNPKQALCCNKHMAVGIGLREQPFNSSVLSFFATRFVPTRTMDTGTRNSPWQTFLSLIS